MERIPRKGEYLVIFSDGTELRILKQHLAGAGIEEGASMSRDRIAELERTYEYARARQAALRLLNVRPRTELEIRRRLRALRSETVRRLIDDLKAEGLVSDRVFARLWIGEKLQKGDTGSIKIRRDLEAKGITPDIVGDEMKSALAETDEAEIAERLALKRVGRLRNVPARSAERKVYAYLVRRGFPSPVAAEAVRRAIEVSGGTVDDEIR